MVGISPMIGVSPLELKNIVQKLSTAYGVQAMNQTNKIVQAIFARMNSISIYDINENSSLCIKTQIQTVRCSVLFTMPIKFIRKQFAT